MMRQSLQPSLKQKKPVGIGFAPVLEDTRIATSGVPTVIVTAKTIRRDRACRWDLQLPAGENCPKKRGCPQGKPLQSSLRSLLFFFLLLLSLSSCKQEKAQPSLLLYCAAGLQKPVSEIAEAYRKKTGLQLEIQWGGSGTLLNNLQLVGKGDIYIPADSSYIDLASGKQLIAQSKLVAFQEPVLVVQKGNPKKVKNFDDLNRLTLSCANPDAASIGKQCQRILGKKWPQFAQSITVMKSTVNESLNDVLIGAVDAAVVWRPLTQGQAVEIIELDEFKNELCTVAIASLKSSKKTKDALTFLHFVQESPQAKQAWIKHGYRLEP